MSKYVDFSVNLVTKLVIAIAINLCFIFPALAITQKLQFDTNTGYKIEAIFSYPKTENIKIIREQGKGQTEFLDSLRVMFYKPSGELMASYRNIIDGTIAANYFEFNYDLTTKQILDGVDLGGESAGEIYLKGTAGKELSLIEINLLGEEKIIDKLVSN